MQLISIFRTPAIAFCIEIFVEGIELTKDNINFGENVTPYVSHYLYWDLEMDCWTICNCFGEGATYTVIYDAYTNTLSSI